MRVKQAELERIGKDLGNFGAFLLENARDIAYRANTDADDGIRAISYDGQRSGSGHSDPVASRVAKDRWDPVQRAEDRFVSRLRELAVWAKEAERQGRGYLALSLKQANAILKGGTIGDSDDDEDRVTPFCANPACGRDVANTPNDRLRAGRCTPCYVYRLRNEVERPRELCHPAEVEEAV